jgi:glycosyltransferase involved in cell wall biosynthesis
MKVTVITACLNAAGTIERSINSVLWQEHSDIEHIIVDGLSTDDTWSIVQRYGDAIAIAMSQKDDGVYDAINKGIMMSSGEIIHVLGSDDYFVSPYALSRISSLFAERDDLEILLTDYIYDMGASHRFRRNPAKIDKGTFLVANVVCHQAMFCRRSVFDKVGLFDTSFRISSDLDWNIRAFGYERVKYIHVPLVLCAFSRGGLSSKGPSNPEPYAIRSKYFNRFELAYAQSVRWSRRVRSRLGRMI